MQDLARLADQVSAVLARHARQRLVLFGHSMGALLAYESAVRLEHRHLCPPAGLIVSGMQDPHHRPLAQPAADDDHLAALVEERLGHLGPDHDFSALALTTLRSDYRAVLTYRPAPPDTLLSCPVAAFTGSADEAVPVHAVLPWRRRTTGAFSVRSFPGGHLYLEGFPASVAEAVHATAHAMGGTAARPLAEGCP